MSATLFMSAKSASICSEVWPISFHTRDRFAKIRVTIFCMFSQMKMVTQVKKLTKKIFCQIVSVSRNFFHFSAERIVSVQPEPVETVFPEPEFELQDYSPSLEVRIFFHPTGWNFYKMFVYNFSSLKKPVSSQTLKKDL